MNRSEQRENAFKLLFNKTFYAKAEQQEQSELFFAYADGMEDVDEQVQAAIVAKVDGAIEHLEGIDAAIAGVAEGWELNRMNRVDLTILRLAYYEMKYDKDTPVEVAVYEAVELAKQYSGENSPSFVNGVLRKLVKEA